MISVAVSVLDYTFESSTVSGTSVQNVGSGGSSYNGQLMNGASISTTDFRVGSASLQLVASSSQYVSLPAFSVGSTGLTFACWFRSSANGDWARILDFGNGQYSDNIFVFTYGGNLGVGVYLGNSYSGYQYTNVYPNVNGNVWRHFVWTLSVAGSWVVYINGVLVWSMSGQPYPNTIPRTVNYIGRSNWGIDPYYTGAIDEFRMYNSVLAQVEVTALWIGKKMLEIHPKYVPTATE